MDGNFKRKGEERVNMNIIKLTDSQASLLNFYILMTAKYREGEIKPAASWPRKRKKTETLNIQT